MIDLLRPLGTVLALFVLIEGVILIGKCQGWIKGFNDYWGGG